MHEPALFTRYPERIRYDTEHPDQVYARVSGYYAVSLRPGEEPASGAVFLLQEPAIAVYAGHPGEANDTGLSALQTPVYALQPDGPLAVPTGRVFIRCAEGVDVTTRREDFLRAGYTIIHHLAYAPHAAWLRALDDDVAAALTRLPALEALPGVENVAPQLLTPPARRH